MPFRAISIEDIEAKIKKIEIASESWVLPEYIGLYLKPLSSKCNDCPTKAHIINGKAYQIYVP